MGTERLLNAMASSACRRLVLCSSFTVYNYSAIGRILDEDLPLYQAPDVYTVSVLLTPPSLAWAVGR